MTDQDSMNALYQHMHQEVQVLLEQIKMIDSSLVQLNNALESVKELKDAKDNEILVPLASGIFYKVKSINADEVLVNVGNDVFVNKSLSDVQTLLDEQIVKMQDQRTKLLEQYQNSIAMLENFQK